jgi:hypothetical protein
VKVLIIVLSILELALIAPCRGENLLNRISGSFLETPQGLITEQAELYSENKKWVLYFSAKAPTNMPFASPAVTLSIDLADYCGLTKEGKNGWVTVWLEPSIVGKVDANNPLGFFNTGLELRSFDPERPDQRPGWIDASVSAGPLLEVAFANGGAEFSADIPFSFIELGDTAALLAGDFNALAPDYSVNFAGPFIEIRREELDKAFDRAFVPGASLVLGVFDLVNVTGELATGSFNWRRHIPLRLGTSDDGEDLTENYIRSMDFETVPVVGCPNALLITFNSPVEGNYSVDLLGEFPAIRPNWMWDEGLDTLIGGTLTASIDVNQYNVGQDQILRFPVVPEDNGLFVRIRMKRGLVTLNTRSLSLSGAYDPDRVGCIATTHEEIGVYTDGRGNEFVRVLLNHAIPISYLNDSYYYLTQGGERVAADYEITSPWEVRIYPSMQRSANTTFRLHFGPGRRDLFRREMSVGYVDLLFEGASLGIPEISATQADFTDRIRVEFGPIPVVADGVRIYRSRSEASPTLLVTEVSSGEFYDDTDVESGEYFYQASYFSGLEEGAKSDFAIGSKSGYSEENGSIQVNPGSVEVNGTAWATISASVKDSLGRAIPNELVVFDDAEPQDGTYRNTAGQAILPPISVRTDENGVAQIRHVPSSTGTYSFSVQVGNRPAEVVSYGAVPDSGATLTLKEIQLESATPDYTIYNISVWLRNSSGDLVFNSPVLFTTSSGSFESSNGPSEFTDDTGGFSGIASVRLFVSTSGGVTVTASSTDPVASNSFDFTLSGGGIPEPPAGDLIPSSGGTKSLKVSAGVLGLKTENPDLLEFYDAQTLVKTATVSAVTMQ